jgi:peptidyl-prolyl cis-trans isomerase D
MNFFSTSFSTERVRLMLDFLRKRKRSWIITLLLGIIVITFVAFYGGSKYQNQGGSDVAEVNGQAISQREFTLQYQRTLERYRELLKGSLTPEMLKNLNIKGNVLEELIQKRLALQEAQSLGITASDEELVNSLAQVPDFQVAGRFNKDRYLQLLRVNNLNPSEFEEEQRQQLTIQRLYAVILDSVHVTDAEVRDRYRVEQEKINLHYVRLPLSDFIPEVQLTEDEVKQFYDRNKESLKEPLKIQVEYLSYPFEQFLPSAQIDDKEVENYYQANRESKFHHPKQAKVRYISLRLTPAVEAKQKDEVKARASRILADARAGKDFAQLAKQNSDDPSAEKGGDVGWVVQGQLPPTIDKPIFSLAKGEVSNVIETPGGLEIVKVEDTKEEKTESLKEATAEITRTLKAEKGKRDAAAAADRDREKALSGTDFGKLAQERGAAVSVTRWFSNGEVLPEIGPNQEFYKTAFALSAKEISPVIEGTKDYYVLRIKERKEPTVPALEAVRSNIEKGLKESKAHERLLQKANSLLEQLKKEREIARLAEQSHLKLEETGWFARSAQQLPKIGELSEIKASGIVLSVQKPIAERVYAQKDAAYILAFKETQGADMERFEKEKDTLSKQAMGETRQRVLQKFMEGLKAKAKIQVHTATLEEG